MPPNSHGLIRSDDLRTANRLRILRVLRTSGPLSRTELGKRTGLSAGSVSTLVGELTDQGIIAAETIPPRQAADKNTVRRGRPQTRVALHGNAGVAATLALTIDNLTLQLLDYRGQLLYSRDIELKTLDLSRDRLLQTMEDGISDLLEQQSDKAPLQHIAVGIQGITEHASGDLLWTPILTTKRVPVRKALERSFATPVSVNNDCRLIAEALHATEHAVLGDSFVTVMFSQGVGMGLYLDGKPFSGTRSSALELGHVLHRHDGPLCRCGKYGCIEAYAADYGIERGARGDAPDSAPIGRVSRNRMQAIADASESGNTLAREALHAAGAAVGEGLGNVFNLFEPMPVALVGRNPAASATMIESLLPALHRSHREDDDTRSLIHCFSHSEPLLTEGLGLHALTHTDQHLAYAGSDVVLPDSSRAS